MLGWWYKNVDPYMNYPGFEVWRFLNLIIFFAIMTYLLKKPLSSAFKAKREVIRADLIQAEEAKQAALAKLTEAEAKLAGLESQKAAVVENARAEARAEQQRIEEEIKADSQRIRGQAESEISRKEAQVRSYLRRFSAEESVRLAEEKIKSLMNAETDSRLVKANIRSIGGLN